MINKAQKKWLKTLSAEYIDNEFELIKKKESKLPHSKRDLICALYTYKTVVNDKSSRRE